MSKQKYERGGLLKVRVQVYFMEEIYEPLHLKMKFGQ
jgi:hypothetical protein